jgi:ubiquinone/menaquinone biosynthesis C-methylase UbiE
MLFDRWSATYDRPDLQRRVYRPIHDAVVDRLTVVPSSMLDLGCGTGHLTERLCRRFPSAGVVGVDYSRGMLRQAAVRLTSTRADLVLANAQLLPFDAASFDVVTCTDSFHWYPDQRQALDEIARVLRPGGRVLIVSLATLTAVGDGLVRRVSAATGQPIRAMPADRLARLLGRAGFDVDEQRRLPRAFAPWPVLTDATRRASPE